MEGDFWARLSKDDIDCLQTEEVMRIITAADDYFYSVRPHCNMCDSM